MLGQHFSLSSLKPNKMELVLFGMQMKAFGRYLAAMHRITIPVMFAGPIAIVEGRHPVMEVLCDGQFQPNDAYLSGCSSFHIITGMSRPRPCLHWQAAAACSELCASSPMHHKSAIP
jgi:hypothetical protein